VHSFKYGTIGRPRLGRYVAVTHVWHPDELVGVTGELLE
jgi:hypothetical protein